MAQSERTKRLLLDAIRAPQELPALREEDWELLVRVARRARLLGRLESDLSSAGLFESIPTRAAAHLKAARNVIEHRKTLVSWEVNRILWAVGNLGSPIILLKGAAYVMANLPPARGRIFADVDLLVPERVLGDIERRLIEHGWLRQPIHPYDDRYYRLWTHEIPPLRHRERGTEIDIHHRLLPRTSRFRFDPTPLFASAQPLSDPRLRVLAPSDMVLHAMIHLFLEGSPHEGLRFRDLVDIHDLLCHYGSKDRFWVELRDRARGLGLERLLFYALRHAHRLLATPVPSSVLEDLAESVPRGLRKVMDALISKALLPQHPDHGSARATISRLIMYIRAHWLRMPPTLLARHLSYKAWLRFRGVPDKVDLAQLDLKQQ